MAEAVEAEPVCLIVGLLSAYEPLFAKAEEALCGRCGPLRASSDVMPFAYTDYYEAEMGGGLLRRFLAFETLIPPDRLASIKRWTNDLEKRLAVPPHPVARPINIDPGYLTPAKLVLATTKDQAHRIYLDMGVYAEITLTYRRGLGYQPNPWTYPDYRTEAYRRFFEQVRDDMLAAKRAASRTPHRSSPNSSSPMEGDPDGADAADHQAGRP